MNGTEEMLNLNWSIVCLDLCHETTMATENKAITCSMSSGTIHKLKNKEIRQPRWDQGVRLLDLHATLCPEKHTIERLTNNRATKP